jgi:uncharacterized protein (TIGR02996 family)
MQLVSEAEWAFIDAISEERAAVHKLAYADWLEERGRADEAHAYRWAAHRDRHPKVTPAWKHCVWQMEPPGQKQKASYHLPRELFAMHSTFATKYHSTCLTNAFQWLAMTLKKVKALYQARP